MGKKGFTLVEIIISILIASFVLIVAIVTWVQSSSSITKGKADLSNLYESGRIFAMIRNDLGEALYFEPPFSTESSSGYKNIKFKMLDKNISVDPIDVEWKFDSSRRVLYRIINGKKYEYGRGKISNFNAKILLYPETNDIKKAEKASIELVIEMAPKNGRFEEGKKLKYIHVITPFNFNLFLKSKYSFK